MLNKRLLFVECTIINDIMTSTDIKNTFLSGLDKYDNLLDILVSKFPSYNASNIDGYFVYRCGQIQKIFHTFVLIVSSTCDSHSAQAILRILADHVASLKLIYTETSKEKIILRHMLYVMDGCKERIKLNQNLKKDPNIDDPGIHNADRIIKNENEAIRICKNIITKLQIYSQNTAYIDRLLQHACWKYKDEYNNEYKWKDLYKDVLDMPNDYISYLSQHVHGLAGGIGSDDDNPEYLLYGTAMCLQSEFSKTIITYFHIKV